MPLQKGCHFDFDYLDVSGFFSSSYQYAFPWESVRNTDLDFMASYSNSIPFDVLDVHQYRLNINYPFSNVFPFNSCFSNTM